MLDGKRSVSIPTHAAAYQGSRYNQVSQQPITEPDTSRYLSSLSERPIQTSLSAGWAIIHRLTATSQWEQSNRPADGDRWYASPHWSINTRTIFWLIGRFGAAGWSGRRGGIKGAEGLEVVGGGGKCGAGLAVSRFKLSGWFQSFGRAS